MFNLFKKKNPDREAIHHVARNLVASANQADKMTRIAVGHAINMANSMFIKKFGSVEGFQATPKPEQIAYIKASTEFVEKLINQDPVAAVGARFFSIWVTGISANDQPLLSILEDTMSSLSIEGNLGG